MVTQRRGTVGISRTERASRRLPSDGGHSEQLESALVAQNQDDSMTRQARSRTWAWLFPLTYVLHATEEYACGETFPVWISRILGVHFTATGFLWLNGVAMAAMIGVVWLAQARDDLRWLLTTLATIITVNGAAHVLGSLASRSYSPGVVTGTFLWLPLGIAVLRSAWHHRPHDRFALGVVTGFAAHAAVSLSVCLG